MEGGLRNGVALWVSVLLTRPDVEVGWDEYQDYLYMGETWMRMICIWH